MIILNGKQFMDKGGWFIGNFEPTAYKTDLFEVCYKLHRKGEIWPKHHHKFADEINFLMRGSMQIGNITINYGQVFIIEKNESVKPIFLEDCELIVVKVPCVKNDKYED